MWISVILVLSSISHSLCSPQISFFQSKNPNWVTHNEKLSRASLRPLPPSSVIIENNRVGVIPSRESIYSFKHEGITPQSIITGCEGITYANGRTQIQFYIIDASGHRKIVSPGSSLKVDFPGPLLFYGYHRKDTVNYDEMCFPKECGSQVCGYIVGPVKENEETEGTDAQLTLPSNPSTGGTTFTIPITEEEINLPKNETEKDGENSNPSFSFPAVNLTSPQFEIPVQGALVGGLIVPATNPSLVSAALYQLSTSVNATAPKQVPSTGVLVGTLTQSPDSVLVVSTSPNGAIKSSSVVSLSSRPSQASPTANLIAESIRQAIGGGVGIETTPPPGTTTTIPPLVGSTTAAPPTPSTPPPPATTTAAVTTIAPPEITTTTIAPPLATTTTTAAPPPATTTTTAPPPETTTTTTPPPATTTTTAPPPETTTTTTPPSATTTTTAPPPETTTTTTPPPATTAAPPPETTTTTAPPPETTTTTTTPPPATTTTTVSPPPEITTTTIAPPPETTTTATTTTTPAETTTTTVSPPPETTTTTTPTPQTNTTTTTPPPETTTCTPQPPSGCAANQVSPQCPQTPSCPPTSFVCPQIPTPVCCPSTAPPPTPVCPTQAVTPQCCTPTATPPPSSWCTPPPPPAAPTPAPCGCTENKQAQEIVPAFEISLPAKSVNSENSQEGKTFEMPRADVEYYAALPGAVRGDAGIVYYPSCDRNAFRQHNIIPFCFNTLPRYYHDNSRGTVPSTNPRLKMNMPVSFILRK